MRLVGNFELDSIEQVSNLLSNQPTIALDVETVSLDNRLPLGIAVAASPEQGVYFFNPEDELLKEIVASASQVIIHNASFDIPILEKLGFSIQRYEDTKLLAYSSGLLENSLERLSLTVLSKQCPSVTSQWKKKDQGNIGIDHVKMGGMCIIHACNTFGLWDKLPHPPLYETIDRPCIDLVVEMEGWGLLIDQVRLTEVEQDAVVKAAGMEQELKEELGDINLASNPQVAKALQDRGIIGTRKTKANKDSVSEESLKPLNHPVANLLLKYRSEMKTITTYVPAFRAVDLLGRIHTHFGYTETGRWKSSGPNLQNVTNNELRDCIVAPPGYVYLSIDADQLELRVIAILSQDPLLLEAIATEDPFITAAIQLLGWTDDKEVMAKRRYDTKQGNYATIYGADEYTLAEMMGIPVSEAREFQQNYFDRFKVMTQYIESVKRQAKKDGFVTNLFGRKRPIPELQSGSWKLREEGEREALSTVVQSTAVDIVKLMMLYMEEELTRSILALSTDIKLVLQIHDEMIWEVPKDMLESVLEVGRELALAFPDFPCSMKVGSNYGGLEGVK